MRHAATWLLARVEHAVPAHAYLPAVLEFAQSHRHLAQAELSQVVLVQLDGALGEHPRLGLHRLPRRRRTRRRLRLRLGARAPRERRIERALGGGSGGRCGGRCWLRTGRSSEPAVTAVEALAAAAPRDASDATAAAHAAATHRLKFGPGADQLMAQQLGRSARARAAGAGAAAGRRAAVVGAIAPVPLLAPTVGG